MNIFILGGTGLMSREIAKEAVTAGHNVTVFNRGLRTADLPPEVEIINGDRKDFSDFKEKVKNIYADIVIDMICYDENDAVETLNAFDGRASQFIFTSSSAVYDRPYRSFPIREECETFLTDERFQYGIKKASMEKYLQTQMVKIPITIIRPSLTFGIGGSNMGVLRQNYNIVDRSSGG